MNSLKLKKQYLLVVYNTLTGKHGDIYGRGIYGEEINLPPSKTRKKEISISNQYGNLTFNLGELCNQNPKNVVHVPSYTNPKIGSIYNIDAYQIKKNNHVLPKACIKPGDDITEEVYDALNEMFNSQTRNKNPSEEHQGINQSTKKDTNTDPAFPDLVTKFSMNLANI